MNTDNEVKKYLKNIAASNKWYNVIFRGCITGIFSAIGVLLGTGIILVVGARILSTQQIPFLSEFLESTKLDVLIESQVNQLAKSTDAKVITYSNSLLGLTFSYPSELNTLIENDSTKIYVTELSGTGALNKLQVYKSNLINISGLYVNRSFYSPALQDITVKNYSSAQINSGQNISNIYVAQIKYNNQDLTIVGFANPASPKLAREVFYDILYSLEVKK